MKFNHLYFVSLLILLLDIQASIAIVNHDTTSDNTEDFMFETPSLSLSSSIMFDSLSEPLPSATQFGSSSFSSFSFPSFFFPSTGMSTTQDLFLMPSSVVIASTPSPSPSSSMFEFPSEPPSSVSSFDPFPSPSPFIPAICEDGDIILGSLTISEDGFSFTGVFLVCVSGRFVTVCADNFDFNDPIIQAIAEINICRGGNATFFPSMGNSTIDFLPNEFIDVITNLSCSDPNSFSSCDFDISDDPMCIDHSQDIILQCDFLDAICEDGDTSLASLTSSEDNLTFTGVFLVCVSGRFVTVCADNFDFDDLVIQAIADNICGQGEGTFLSSMGNSTIDFPANVITNVSCSDPNSLSACDFDFSDDPMCLDHSQDIILECDFSGLLPSISFPSFSFPSISFPSFSFPPFSFPSTGMISMSTTQDIFMTPSSSMVIASTPSPSPSSSIFEFSSEPPSSVSSFDPFPSPSPFIPAICEDGDIILGSLTVSEDGFSFTGVFLVCVSGRFVTVCADNFDFNDPIIQAIAEIDICRGGNATFLPSMGNSTIDFLPNEFIDVITNLSCSDPNSFSSCDFDFSDDPMCIDHSQDIILQCDFLDAVCEDGDTTLASLTFSVDDLTFTGVFLVCVSGRFVTVCADNFDFDDLVIQAIADNICGQGEGTFLSSMGNFTIDFPANVITNVSCSDPNSLSACDFDFSDDPMCLDHSQDIILECDFSGLLPSISFPSFSFPSFSFPSISFPSFSFPPFSFPSTGMISMSTTQDIFMTPSSSMVIASTPSPSPSSSIFEFSSEPPSSVSSFDPFPSPSPFIPAICEDGDIILGSLTISEDGFSFTGVFLVCVSGRFVTVCADNFDFNDPIIQAIAEIDICRGGNATFFPSMGNSTIDFLPNEFIDVITNLSCSDPNSFSSCDFDFSDDPMCIDHSQDIILQCDFLDAVCEDGDTTLASLTFSVDDFTFTGVFLVCVSGRFVTVCADNFDFDDLVIQAIADNICGQGEGTFLSSMGNSTIDFPANVITNVSCSDPNSLSACDFDFSDDPMCLDHSQDIILECDFSGLLPSISFPSFSFPSISFPSFSFPPFSFPSTGMISMSTTQDIFMTPSSSILEIFPSSDLFSSSSIDFSSIVQTPSPSPSEDIVSFFSSVETPSPSPSEDIVSFFSSIETPSPLPSEDIFSSIETPSPSPSEDIMSFFSSVETPSPSPSEDIVSFFSSIETPSPSPSEDIFSSIETSSPPPSVSFFSSVETPSPSPSEDIFSSIEIPSEDLSFLISIETPSPSPSEDILSSIQTPSPSPSEDILSSIQTPSPSPSEDILSSIQTPSPSPSEETSIVLEETSTDLFVFSSSILSSLEFSSFAEISTSMLPFSSFESTLLIESSSLSLDISSSPFIEITPSSSVVQQSPSMTIISSSVMVTPSSVMVTPSPSPEVPEIRVLIFINLDVNVAPINFLPRRVDSSALIELSTTIIIGENIFTRLYVNDNGVISLGSPFLFWQPTQFPTTVGRIALSNVFAAYWADVDNRVEGDVRYQVLTDNTIAEQAVLSPINEYIRDTQGVNFTGTFAVVAEWDRVHPYNHARFFFSPESFEGITAEFLNSTNTFQAIVISDSSSTYVIYTYKCGELEWAGLDGGFQPVIGYNIQGLPPNNEPQSGSNFIINVACRNQPQSDFVNIVYNFIGDPALPMLQCLAAVQRDFLFAYVPQFRCPCSLFQAFRDRRYFPSFFTSDAFGFTLCYSPPFTFFLSNILCCYRFGSSEGSGSLIQSGPYASTAISANPFFQRGDFFANEIEFRRLCCIQGDFCDEYLRRRELQTCFGYRPPRFTWFWGDPHFRTLDGRRYTFNGLGEYLTIDANGMFQLQARTGIAGNSSATIFTAYAASDLADNSERVQVEIDPNTEMLIRVNGIDITSNLTNVNDTVDGTTVMLMRSSEDTVSVSFQSTIGVDFSLRAGTLAATSQIPSEFNGTLTGLLGNFDGDDTNDFMYRNLTLAGNDINDREKHIVAQTWQVTQEESLFFYQDGQNVSSFSDPNHEPVYLDEVPAETLAGAVEVCGSIENIECLFDLVQTNNEALAMTTSSTNNQNNEDQEIVANFPPTINGSNTFRLDISVSSTFEVIVADPGDTFNVSVVGVTGTLPTLTFVQGTEEGQYILTITLNIVQSFTISIVATDSLGASSSLEPQIEICGCVNGGNCTLDGIVELSANPLILECECPEAWTGSFCADDFDGCLVDSCFEGAPCTDTPAPMTGITCPACPQGFVGDGQKCFDFDECANSTTNTCEQLCMNTLGSFLCACQQGFELTEDGRTCRDVDECSNNEHDCEHLCANDIGTFNCSCQLGFILNSDRKSCDPDPDATCPDDNICEQLCGLNITTSNTASSGSGSGIGSGTGSGSGSGTGTGTGTGDFSAIVCACLNGFTLDDSLANCTDIDECALSSTNPCQQNCTNSIGDFDCSCQEGFNQNGFLCEDINECAQLNACGDFQICTNTPGSFFCTCQLGLQMNESSGVCEDIDECIESPCQQKCTNVFGSFMCTCFTGFELLINNRNCSNINECIVSNTCPSDQTCIDTEGSFVCMCQEGFIMNDQGACVEIITTSSIIPSPSPSSSIVPTSSPTPISSPELLQTVRLSLIGVTENDFNDTQRQIFRMAVANAINAYCNDNSDRCTEITTETGRKRDLNLNVKTHHKLIKRQLSDPITADDIVITSTQQLADRLVVTFFVRGRPGAVIPATDVATSLREQIDILEAAGFNVEDIFVVNPSTDSDQLNDGEIAGIVIAVVIFVVIVVVGVTLIVYCCWRQKSSGRYAFVEKGPTAKDDFTIKNISYDPEARKSPDDISVHSMTLNFKTVDSDDGDDDDDDDDNGGAVLTNKKANLDDSEETYL